MIARPGAGTFAATSSPTLLGSTASTPSSPRPPPNAPSSARRSFLRSAPDNSDRWLTAALFLNMPPKGHSRLRRAQAALAGKGLGRGRCAQLVDSSPAQPITGHGRRHFSRRDAAAALAQPAARA
eukprot:366185-Chlamydomonas_euryale.AAC.3